MTGTGRTSGRKSHSAPATGRAVPQKTGCSRPPTNLACRGTTTSGKTSGSNRCCWKHAPSWTPTSAAKCTQKCKCCVRPKARSWFRCMPTMSTLRRRSWPIRAPSATSGCWTEAGSPSVGGSPNRREAGSETPAHPCTSEGPGMHPRAFSFGQSCLGWGESSLNFMHYKSGHPSPLFSFSQSKPCPDQTPTDNLR